MFRFSSGALATTIALAVIAFACSSDVADGGGADTTPGDTGSSIIGRSCRNNVDCDGEAACLDGLCGKDCDGRDTDCPDPSYQCWGFRCVPRTSAPDVVDAGGGGEDVAPRTPCASHTDCPTGEGCIDGTCGWECYSPADCPNPGDDCLFYDCVPREADVSEPPRDVVSPADVPDEPDVPAPPDVPILADVPDEPDVPRPHLGYGEVCAGGSDCASGLCLQVKDHGVARCTAECGSVWDCPAPDYCGGPVADPEEAFPLDILPMNVCITQDTGEPCANGCTSGLSFGSGGSCVCTAPCASAVYCQHGAVCADDASGWQLCVPIGQGCDPRAVPAPACYGMICYPLSETRGFCTGSCLRNDDCPDGWLCHVETIDDQTIRTCHPQG